MSRRGDTHRKPLPEYTYHDEAVPPKSLDGQYSYGRKSTDLKDRKRNDQATESKPRKLHRELEARSERKRMADASEKAYRAFAEMHDVRAGISPEKRHRREHPRRGDYFVKEDESPRYPLPKSTSFHSEDQDVLFESPLYPDSPAGRPSNPYDASSSQYHRKPVAHGQPSTRGEASSSSPRIGLARQNNVRSEPAPGVLKRTFSDESTRSHDSMYSIDLNEILEEDYEEYVVVPDHVKVPGRHKKDWLHPFR